MPIEKRTRVEIFVPMRADLTGYQEAIDWFAEELALTRGGATVTAPFAGLYASTSGVELVSDSIRILFCDFDSDPTVAEEHDKLLAYIEEVKRGLMKLLEEEEIWVVMHPIDRVIS